jgi:Pyruvate/2-oxoacid:ferredoxin oxidoreductase delta subunit
MRPIQTFGLVLFILSFATFILALSLSKFQITEEVLSKVISEKEKDKREAFQNVASEMMGKSYSSQFTFVAEVKEVLKKANQNIKDKYAISDKEIAQIIAKNPAKTYELSKIEGIFKTEEPLGEYKAQAVKDYTNWMEGREFNSPEELQNNLKEAIEGINNSVINQKGFPEYDTKNFAFQITKKSSKGFLVSQSIFLLIFIFLGGTLGALLYIYPQRFKGTPGIKNDHIFQSGLTNRGAIGISIGVFLISFYIVLYFYPYYITNWVILVDPISYALNGGEASQWFLYGILYTLAILVMGVRMMVKYRHSPYQIWRTGSVMFFQTSFAFIIPQMLIALHLPYMDLKNIWPLDYDLFTPSRLNGFMEAGNIGYLMLSWGIILTIIGVPLMVYFFGKRWYCSWVCGCGGLAETLGDPYRQLSDKSLKAWQIERYLVHGVLVFAIVMTGMMLYTFFTDSGEVLGLNSYTVKEWYGFLIASIFAGVVGTGFYPFMGNRVWCRFGCPLAAYLGLVQRFQSRFRITTNGGQCISCGNCSTYCEMGIDVRWYAQRGQDIVRSSCVGCGVCSSVCPRGVLNLENGPTQDRINSNPILIGNDSVKVNV